MAETADRKGALAKIATHYQAAADRLRRPSQPAKPSLREFARASAVGLLVAGGAFILGCIFVQLLDLLGRGIEQLGQSELAQLGLHPIKEWIRQHATGLPVTASTLTSLYLIVGVVLFFAASCRSRGGQIGWVTYGATAVAMAWVGTNEPLHQPVAAGLMLIVWTLLSIVALRRPSPLNVVSVHTAPAAAEHTTSDLTPKLAPVSTHR